MWDWQLGNPSNPMTLYSSAEFLGRVTIGTIELLNNTLEQTEGDIFVSFSWGPSSRVVVGVDSRWKCICDVCRTQAA